MLFAFRKDWEFSRGWFSRDSNYSVFRVRRFTEWPRTSSLNCLSCKNPYQASHSTRKRFPRLAVQDLLKAFFRHARVQNAPTRHTSFRKNVGSIKFPPVIPVPEMAVPILWAPGIFWFFLLKNPHAHKIPPFRGGVLGFFRRGGGSANFDFMGAGIFPDSYQCLTKPLKS